MEQVIPKIIHYCWFGDNPKPQLVINCINSWKKHCPDYEIIEWNENTFDIHSNAFVEEAYKAKKWAFVSDYVRAFVLLRSGGIYLDTDIELIRSIDHLLEYSFFAGFESNDTLGSAVLGCVKDCEVMHKYLCYYQDKHFDTMINDELITSPIVLTKVLADKGLKMDGKRQSIGGGLVCPKPVFYPMGIGWVFDKYRHCTIGIHHFMDSWGKNNGLEERSKLSKIRLCVIYFSRDLLGTEKIHELGRKIHNKQKREEK